MAPALKQTTLKMGGVDSGKSMSKPKPKLSPNQTNASRKKSTPAPPASSQSTITSYKPEPEYITISSGSGSSDGIVEISPPPSASTSRFRPPGSSQTASPSVQIGSRSSPATRRKRAGSSSSSKARKRSHSGATLEATDTPRPKPKKRAPPGGRTIAQPIIIESSEDEGRVVADCVFVVVESPMSMSASKASTQPPLRSRSSSKAPMSALARSASASLVQQNRSTSQNSASPPKRPAPLAPLEDSARSPKRPRVSESPSEDEVIPSSEGEEETDLPPLERETSRDSLAASSSTISSSTHPPASAPSELPYGPRSRTVSYDRSAMEVEEQLANETAAEDEPSPKAGPSFEPATPEAASSIVASSSSVSGPISRTSRKSNKAQASSDPHSETPASEYQDDSDGDSVHSAKAFKRAMNFRTSLSDDEDDDLLNNANLLAAIKPRGLLINKGKEPESRSLPSPSARQVQKAVHTMQTNSPLSSPSVSRSLAVGARPPIERASSSRTTYPNQTSSSQQGQLESNKDVSPAFGSSQGLALPQTPTRKTAGRGRSEDEQHTTSLGENLVKMLDQPTKVTAKINDILKDDQEDLAHIKRVQGRNKDVLGRCLWKPISGDLDIESPSQALGFSSEGSKSFVVLTLAESANTNDIETLIVMLTSGCLLHEPTLPDELIDWLLDLSCLSSNSRLGRAAMSAIAGLLASSSLSLADVELDWSTVRRLLIGLGVRDDFLTLIPTKKHDEDQMHYASWNPQSKAERDDRLWRLVQVVGLFAKSKQLAPKDEPPIILSLVFIAIDAGSSVEMKEETIRILRFALACIDARSNPYRSEMTTLKLLLGACEKLSIDNQLAVLHVLSGNYNEQSTRLARWLAYGLLFGTPSAIKSEERYFKAPPLTLALTLALSNDIEPEEGALESHSMRLDRSTDYNALRSTTIILGFLLTGMESYVAADRLATTESVSHLIEALKVLQSKISDYKASNLEKTYAKNAIHHLATRLTYQTNLRKGSNMTSLGNAEQKRPVKITNFFTKKTKEKDP